MFPISLYHVDNTNRDVKTRKYYVDVAQRLGVPVRYVILNATSIDRHLYFADVSNFPVMPTSRGITISTARITCRPLPL